MRKKKRIVKPLFLYRAFIHLSTMDFTIQPLKESVLEKKIVEAPYNNGILPLTHFNTGHLMQCTATINGALNAIGSFANIAYMVVGKHNKPNEITSSLLTDKKSFSVICHGE